MTREEEINNASYAYWVNNYANIEFIDEEEKELHTQDIQDSFINGAKWADARPINYDGKAMLYVNQRSHDNGYKEAVDKAVEWLEKNVADIWNSPCNPDKIVEDFRKAMEGE